MQTTKQGWLPTPIYSPKIDSRVSRIERGKKLFLLGCFLRRLLRSFLRSFLGWHMILLSLWLPDHKMQY